VSGYDDIIWCCARSECAVLAVARMGKHPDAVAWVTEGGVEVWTVLALHDVDYVVGVQMHRLNRIGSARLSAVEDCRV
jgi:hypothetical protein